MNLEDLQGVFKESWQKCAPVEPKVKVEPCDEHVKSETSVLSLLSTASTEANETSSIQKNRFQPELVQFITKLPVDIKAENNVNSDELTEYTADGDRYLIGESKNEVGIKTYIKSEHMTSVDESDEHLNQLYNSNFSEDLIKEENFVETKFLIPEVDIEFENEGSDQSNSKLAKVEAEERGHTSKKNGSLNGINRCPDCPYETSNSRQLKSHQRVHSSKEVELHRCPECPFTSKWKSYVTRHLLVHNGFNEGTWYQCPECPFKTKRYTTLKHSHMLKHNRKDVPMYKCTLCSFESPRKPNLQRHLEQVHRPKDSEPIGCLEEGCLFKTRDKYYLARHVKMFHECSQIFKCLKCSYQTKFAQSFRDHELGHENPDKWFSCSVCPYKTPSKSILVRHALVHKSDSETKWFHCSECSFRTKRKDTLNQHKVRHNKVFEKVFECSECRYKTHFVRYFRQHLLKHKSKKMSSVNT